MDGHGGHRGLHTGGHLTPYIEFLWQVLLRPLRCLGASSIPWIHRLLIIFILRSPIELYSKFRSVQFLYSVSVPDPDHRMYIYIYTYVIYICIYICIYI